MSDDGSLTPTSDKEALLSVCERVGVDDVIDDDDDELQLRMFRTYSDPGEKLKQYYIRPSLCSCLVLQYRHIRSIIYCVYDTYVCSGRKKSLKSLEIPLDNLLSGIIFLSGILYFHTVRNECVFIVYGN